MRSTAIQGVGLGLRPQHFPTILDCKPSVPWFEVLADNYLSMAGPPFRNLIKIREQYPVVLHCVGMSVASYNSFDQEYFSKLKQLVEFIEPAWISDHLCWTNNGQHYFNDLLPFPFNTRSLIGVAAKVSRIQEFLGSTILLENISAYLKLSNNEIMEEDFLSELCRLTDCNILLDLNNIYVNSINNDTDIDRFMQNLPAQKVRQFHLAGHESRGDYLLDTHGSEVCDSVWELYRNALRKFGPVPTLIEWDSNLPDFTILECERQKAEKICEAVVHGP